MSATLRHASVILLLLIAAIAGCAPTASSAPDSRAPSSAAPASARAAAQTEPVPVSPAAPSRTFRIAPAQSEASYEVQEKFARFPAPNKAVGRTQTITGDVQISLGAAPQLQGNQFSVDLRTLTSDSGRRDQLIRDQWLESNRYPMAEFTATRIEPLPVGYVEGQDAAVKIVGNMTIRDVTRELTFDAQVKLQGNTLTGTAKTFLLMRDFGFDPPDIFGIVSVEDGVTLTVTFTAQAEG